MAKPIDIDITMVNNKLAELRKLVQDCNNEQKDEIKRIMREVVPTYKENKK